MVQLTSLDTIVTMHFVIVAASLFACAIAAPPVQQRIIGGATAARGQFPYQASFQYRSGGIIYSHVCGATIISPSWSVTAAQCRDSFDLSRYRVVAGLLIQGQNGVDAQTSGIEAFIVHPNYQGGSNTNDIALLLLTTPLQWTDTVQPAKLPTPGGDLSGSATLSSWGSETALQWASLDLLSNSECSAALIAAGSQNVLDDTQICTGPLEGQVGVCHDDLASSLAQDGSVVGLLSWTTICGASSSLAVYTRVDSHNDFILEYVDDL